MTFLMIHIKSRTNEHNDSLIYVFFPSQYLVIQAWVLVITSIYPNTLPDVSLIFLYVIIITDILQ